MQETGSKCLVGNANAALCARSFAAIPYKFDNAGVSTVSKWQLGAQRIMRFFPAVTFQYRVNFRTTATQPLAETL